MNLLIGCVALAYFGIVAVVAEGKPAAAKTLKNNKSKHGLKHR